MHDPIEIRVALIDQEIEIYRSFGSGGDDLEVGHDVSVEALKIVGCGY